MSSAVTKERGGRGTQRRERHREGTKEEKAKLYPFGSD
jgi:hypothetical protein